MFAPPREAFGYSLQSPQRKDSAGRRDISLTLSSAAFPSVQTVRLLDYSGMCRCQMWTARCLSAGLQCSGLCHGRAHCNRTWILLDTVRMLWVNLQCGKWRRISSHSPQVLSFQSHQACMVQSNTARPPAWKHTAASDCHPVHVAAAPFHWLLSCTPPNIPT